MIIVLAFQREGFIVQRTTGGLSITISGVIAGQYLTATATDAAGNTAEFPKNIVAGG